MGGAQHNLGGETSAGDHSAAQARRRAGHRRVPPEQDRDVISAMAARNPIRIISSRNRAEVRRLFARRGQRLDAAERTVVAIVESVRRRGDSALVRYARQWDAFSGKSARQLRVSKEQM